MLYYGNKKKFGRRCVNAYKIVGILLTLSPISIHNDYFYFPYSFLGITLYFLVVLFERKAMVPILDILLWLACAFSILSQKPMSYHLFIIFYTCYQFLYLFTFFQHPMITLVLMMGLIISCIGIFIPLFQLISLGLLAILWIIYYHTKKRTLVSSTIVPELEDTTIPLVQEEITFEDTNYVIPYPEKK